MKVVIVSTPRTVTFWTSLVGGVLSPAVVVCTAALIADVSPVIINGVITGASPGTSRFPRSFWNV
ncbi:MAG TPA: hypothetical protein VFB20_05145, partial [Burkholderiales bacterium]|nr:hypothetical protein [Burkholderiales bacterium]